MQRLPTLSLLLLLSTLPAAKAQAVDLHAASEGRAPFVSLGAFAGGHFFAEGANLGVARGAQASQGARSNAAAGLRASFGLGRWFAAEAEVLGLATEDRTFQRKARILGYRFNAMANLMAGDFRPFVLVGAGAIQVASTDADGNAGLVRDTDGEVHAGVGFDVRLVDKLSLRGDARVVQMPSKQTWGLVTDVEATLGAVVTFDGGARSSVHAPSPEVDAPTAAHSTVVRAEVPVMAPLVAESPRAQVVRQDDQDAQDSIEESRSGEVAKESELVALATNVRTVSDLLERAKEIKFEGTTSKLAEASMPFLAELAAALVKEPGVRLEILCHIGDSGDAKKDLALTKRRAEAVKYLLVGQGASTDQLVATGRGSEDPIAPNLTRSGRMRNERVELHRSAR
jgi:outer membrane protein OmpA-like peptidoglycan-associated protein